MAELTQIEVATHRYIRETPKLVDLIFQQGPVSAYAKLNVREDYDGGRFIAENFEYNGLIGGPYLKGKNFDITEPQIEQQAQFGIKFFEVNVTLSKEDVQVINKGKAAAFRLIDSRMQAAYRTIGAHVELAMFLPGQGVNYLANVNGLPEAIQDGAAGTVSWNNATYATYGTITRGGAVGNALNSAPVNVGGNIQYATLTQEYGNATYGPAPFEPNLIATTVNCSTFIKNRFQTQQRFNDTVDVNIGFRGLKFEGATIVAGRYTPGAYLFGTNGTADPIAVSFMHEMSNGALNAYPAPVGGYPAAGVFAETLWILNARKPFMNFYISDDPEYGFGFTGFKPAQGNTKIAGQVLAALQVTFAPRYHRQLYGITG